MNVLVAVCLSRKHAYNFLLGVHVARWLFLDAQYPTLHNIVRRKNVIVFVFLSGVTLNIEFTRALNGNKYETWLLLVRRLMRINLTYEDYSFLSSLI
jgi:hypothetical protein